MNNWKNDKRNLTKKTQAIVDGLGKSFFKEETIQWLGKRPPKERIDLIERIFEKGQEASKSEKYVLIAGLYEILTNHRILPIDPFKQEMVRIPFDVLLTQIEPVLEEKYAYFDELIKQTLTENPVGTGQKATPAKWRMMWTCVKRIPRWIYVLVLFLAALLTCIYLLWWLWTKFLA